MGAAKPIPDATTRLYNNYANGVLESIYRTGGHLEYRLPAPLGYFLDFDLNSSSSDTFSLRSHMPYPDFPPACAAGVYGNSFDRTKQNNKLCSGLCPAGKTCGMATINPVACRQGGYCPEGSQIVSPCDAGSFGNETNATDPSVCRPCPQGHACGIGAKEPIKCMTGTIAPNQSTVSCIQCPEGKHQSEMGATACIVCGDGYYCPAGSSTPIPASCNEGTYLPALTKFTNQSDCEPCMTKHWCSGGRTAPRKCSVGSFANVTGLGECYTCPAGKYQNEKGGIDCKSCTKGAYCPEGASSPRLCEAGTFGNESSQPAQSDCHTCLAGAYCSTGATEPMSCNPGSFSLGGADLCKSCTAGTFQEKSGQTECKECTKGHFCLEGAAAALPCPGGRFSNTTGLKDKKLCNPVPAGFWAPTGSALPEKCPESGFYCPGYDADEVNTPPGSKPIIVKVGAMSDVEQQVVVMTRATANLTLDQSLEDFDEQELTLRLSRLYNVPTADIQLRVSSGSIIVTFSIVSSNHSLASRIRSVTDDELSRALDGVNVTRSEVSEAQMNETTSRFVESSCPAGHWCSAGNSIPCVRNTFNELRDKFDQSACRPCPVNSVTRDVGSTSFDDCVCARGFFADTRIWPNLQRLRAANLSDTEEFRLNATIFCHRCVAGAACLPDDEDTTEGLTLESLPLQPGYWRNSPMSLDIRSCADRSEGTTPGCRGGAGEPCKDWLDGPLCTLCNVTSGRYYSPDEYACKECDSSTVAVPLALAASLLSAFLIGPPLCVGLRLPRRLGLEVHWRVLKPRLMRLGLTAKFKLLASFYQICTKIPVIYQVQLPDRVQAVLDSISDLITMNFDELWKPLQCLQLRGFLDQLQVLVIVPLAIVLLTPIAAAARIRFGKARRRHSDRHCLHAALIEALPLALLLLFLAYPTVSSYAFLAFNCQAFDGEPFGPWQGRAMDDEHQVVDNQGRAEIHVTTSTRRYYLMADYAVHCYDMDSNGEREYSGEYNSIQQLAYMAILLYPIGVPVLYAVLLFSCHKELRSGRPLSTLSHALRFLYREYEPRFYAWELMVMMQKLLLVGILSQVSQGSLTQSVAGVSAAFVFNVLHMGAQPFQHLADDYLGTATNFSLSVILFIVVILKVAVLRQEVASYLTSELMQRFAFDEMTLTVILLTALFFSLLLAFIFVVRRSVDVSAIQVIRDVKTRAPPTTGLRHGMRFNLFISHAWSSAQDQAATIKRQLQLLVPGCSIFLDVDDLVNINALEEEVAATQVVLMILSRGYFWSKNCMREINATVQRGKPVVLVHETDESKGGALLEVLQDECPQGRTYEHLFGPADQPRHVVQWQRVTVFQLVSLKLIVREMLVACPEYQTQSSAPELYVRNELPRTHFLFESKVLLHVSKHNPGAESIARILKVGMKDTIELAVGSSAFKGRQASLMTRVGMATARAAGMATTRAAAMAPSRASVTSARSTSRGPLAAARATLGVSRAEDDRPTHFLLYLTAETFVGDEGDQLAEEVRRARALSVPILLLHETDLKNHGCNFNHFFGTTPQDLVTDGLYFDVATALVPGPYRPTSIAMVAQKLGATRLKSWHPGSFTTQATAQATEQAAVRAQQAASSSPVHLMGRGSAVAQWHPQASGENSKSAGRRRRSSVDIPQKLPKPHQLMRLDKQHRLPVGSTAAQPPYACDRGESSGELMEPSAAFAPNQKRECSAPYADKTKTRGPPKVRGGGLGDVTTSAPQCSHCGGSASDRAGLPSDRSGLPSDRRRRSSVEIPQQLPVPSRRTEVSSDRSAHSRGERSVLERLSAEGTEIPQPGRFPQARIPLEQLASKETKIQADSCAAEKSQGGVSESSRCCTPRGSHREALDVDDEGRIIFKYAVGARVVHTHHGSGTVVELMDDGRTHVRFDTGEEHRYKQSSMGKFIAEEEMDEESIQTARKHALRSLQRQKSLLEGFAAGTDGQGPCSKDKPARETSRIIRRRTRLDGNPSHQSSPGNRHVDFAAAGPSGASDAEWPDLIPPERPEDGSQAVTEETSTREDRMQNLSQALLRLTSSSSKEEAGPSRSPDLGLSEARKMSRRVSEAHQTRDSVIQAEQGIGTRVDGHATPEQYIKSGPGKRRGTVCPAVTSAVGQPVLPRIAEQTAGQGAAASCVESRERLRRAKMKASVVRSRDRPSVGIPGSITTKGKLAPRLPAANQAMGTGGDSSIKHVI